MSQQPATILTDDAEFIVRESKRVNLFFGILMLLLSVVILYNMDTDYHADQVARYRTMLFLTLVPAIAFMVKGYRHKLLFRINKSGIYRYEKLLTGWNYFLAARITQEEITGSYADNFILLVEFCKEGQPGIFIRKMKLPNTMDKSEEEIVEAIRYFSKFSGNMMPAPPGRNNDNRDPVSSGAKTP